MFLFGNFFGPPSAFSFIIFPMRPWILCFFLLSFFNLPVALSQENLRSVKEVLNGGTLVLDNGEVVRLIGVSAPEKPKDDKPKSAPMSWYRRSKEFTESLVMGRKVWLEFGKVKKDDQGNTWAYVFFKTTSGQTLGSGGSKFFATPGTYMVNRLLIRYGMATVHSPFSFQYRSQFQVMENEAKQNQTGLFQGNF